MKRPRPQCLPTPKFTEDYITSLSEIYGEQYRQRKEKESVSFSSTEEEQSLQINSGQHTRGTSEYASPALQDDAYISESERVIRRIIAARNRPKLSVEIPNDPPMYRLQVSGILKEISGERKDAEERRWKLKQHLLELLEGKKDCGGEGGEDDSDKRSCEGTQNFPDPPSSQVSTSTMQGPGSSFLINATYEQDRPIPEFHECAKAGRCPGRSRSISTHVKEDCGDAPQRTRIALALDFLFPLPSRTRDAVFRLLISEPDAHFVVSLDRGQFQAIYTLSDDSQLTLQFALTAQPAALPFAKVATWLRFDPRRKEFTAIQGFHSEADAVILLQR